jgi:hypothetical protein
MVWTAFGWHGKTRIAMVETTMKAVDYQNLMHKHLLSEGRKIGGRGWIYQQDKHQFIVQSPPPSGLKRRKLEFWSGQAEALK